MKAQKPTVERDYWMLENYDPNALVIKETKPDELEIQNEEEWASRFEIFISSYRMGTSEFWRVRFLHIRICGLNSRSNAIEAGKSLVQAYLQGGYDYA